MWLAKSVLGILSLAAVLSLFFLDLGIAAGSAWAELFVLGHMVFFALLVGIAGRWRVIPVQPVPVRIAVLLALVMVLGVTIEVVQPLFGRGASARDLLFNMLGGTIGLLCDRPVREQLGSRSLVGAWAVLSTACVLTLVEPAERLMASWQASRRFPVLADFETADELTRWSNGRISSEFARHGSHSLRVDLPAGRYPGTAMRRGIGDWRSYEAFAFSVYNPASAPLRLTLSIRDEAHYRRGGLFGDRFDRDFSLVPGWTDLQVGMAEIENAPRERQLDVSAIREVLLFSPGLDSQRVMYVDWMRLLAPVRPATGPGRLAGPTTPGARNE